MRTQAVKAAGLTLLVVAQISLPVSAAVVIRADCGAHGLVRLWIGDHNVGAVPGAPSVVNYASRLTVSNRAVLPGTTSVFWGGIAKWFTSTDGRTRLRADIGVSGGTMLKRIAYSSPRGDTTCRLLEP